MKTALIAASLFTLFSGFNAHQALACSPEPPIFSSAAEVAAVMDKVQHDEDYMDDTFRSIRALEGEEGTLYKVELESWRDDGNQKDCRTVSYLLEYRDQASNENEEDSCGNSEIFVKKVSEAPICSN